MRNLLVAHIPILIALAFIGNARSQASAPETRAEVKADTQAARKAGDMEFGEEGLKANEAHPERYPKKAASSAETRADVRPTLPMHARRVNCLLVTSTALPPRSIRSATRRRQQPRG